MALCLVAFLLLEVSSRQAYAPAFPSLLEAIVQAELAPPGP
jgi:hypothetical protein